MHWLTPAVEIRKELARKHGVTDVDNVLRRLPGAVRRMGLVRCLEWLAVGKKVRLGADLQQRLAPHLLLDPKIAAAVEQLEACDRRRLFRHHRDAVRLFDALATASRLEHS